MNSESIIKALKACCATYEQLSIKQQAIILEQEKEIRRQAQKLARLETVILNNIKNGKNFIK